MRTSVHTNVVVNLIRTITMTLLSFITFPLMCRVLGDEMIGTFSWVTSFIYYFIVLSKISIPNIAVRECAKVKDDPVKLSMKIQEFFILQAVMTLLSFGIMCAIVFSVDAFKSELVQPMVFLISLNFLSSVFAFEWVFTALEKHVYLAVRSVVILAVTDILIFVFIKRPDDVILYTFLTTLVTLLTVISNIIYLPRLVKFKKVGRYNFKQYIPTLMTLFVISFSVALYAKTDEFILGFIDQSKASVGSYSVGMKGVDIVIGIVTALSAVFIPRASSYYASGDEKNFQNLNKYSANIAFIIVVPAIALMTTLAEPITGLISGSFVSSGFKDSNFVLITLCSLTLTYSLSNIIYTQVLIPKKQERLYLYTMLFGVAIDIGLSFLFGLVVFKNSPAIGIALATSITDLLILISLIALTWRDTKAILFNLNNLKIILLGALVAVFSFFVGPLLYKAFLNGGEEYAALLEISIIFIASVAIYSIGLIISKEKLTQSMRSRI